LIGVGFDRVLRFDFEKISRVHRVMIYLPIKVFYGENTHTERDVLTSCFRAESPRSATGIALSGFCSTKFLLLFFGLCYRSAQVGGKAPAHGGRSRLIRVCRRKGFNFGRQGRLTTAVNSCGATSVALGFILIAQS
jgi:hypothetical protein